MTTLLKVVISRTLDSFNFEKIKLLKLEAEGLELEVLKVLLRH